MNITFLKGYPDFMGKRLAWVGYGNGPVAYNPLTGDPVPFPRFNNYIDAIHPALSVSGNYKVDAQPSGPGARVTWTALWSYSGQQGVAGVAVTTAGSGQNNGTFLVAATGGGGSGAQATITIAGGAVTSAALTSTGRGYTSAPAFTIAQGGTPGTLTATGTPASGGVPAGTNLANEIVQLSGFAGVY